VVAVIGLHAGDHDFIMAETADRLLFDLFFRLLLRGTHWWVNWLKFRGACRGEVFDTVAALEGISAILTAALAGYALVRLEQNCAVSTGFLRLGLQN
jgi:hypothetical protein